MDKVKVHSAVHIELEQKISGLQKQFDNLKQSLGSETKSSAGDKHETGRAMAQLEQEKLSKQLVQLINLREALSKVNPSEKHTTIQYGSLVTAANGIFFFSIGLGKIDVEDSSVFCMTATTPLGQAMIGKKEGDTFELNGKSFEIINVT